VAIVSTVNILLLMVIKPVNTAY